MACGEAALLAVLRVAVPRSRLGVQTQLISHFEASAQAAPTLARAERAEPSMDDEALFELSPNSSTATPARGMVRLRQKRQGPVRWGVSCAQSLGRRSVCRQGCAFGEELVRKRPGAKARRFGFGCWLTVALQGDH